MNNQRRFVYTLLNDVAPIFTSHGAGLKKILCSGFGEAIQMKQIAVGQLMANEVIPEHKHLDMDECYYILRGEGCMYINNEEYELQQGTFLNVPAGNHHKLICYTGTLEFFYFGLQQL